ncbi:hypothetical protein P4O66_013384 [Electrophorus voltai]|uniref:PH domain-containing protein n=1 Tax=Electrophorus voltai TaxID=2609070 RepID=A0AAD8Z4P4_9TELE|nr:hypothetical protein P4O66_013384 [Electrophorus voltai]
MSESIVRKIQPFTIGTKLSVPAVPKYSDVTEDNMSNRSLDNCKLQHNLNDKVSLYLDQPQMCVSERHCAPVMTQDTLEKRCQEEMVKEDHLNRNIASPTATSRAIRKITISSSVETTKETEILRAKQREMKINPNSENINNNNNITTDSAQLPRIVGVSCEKKPSSHFKTPVLQSQSLKNDLVKGNSSPCRQNEVSMVSKVLSVQKDYFFTQQNALFSKEISQAEAWIQEKLKKLKDIQTCSMMDWEEVTQTLQRDLKDFENTLIQLNQMGEQLMCKLNPTSDMVRKQLSQLRDQWNTLKQTAANQTRVISGFQSLHEFNKKVDKLEAWIKQKQEEEPSLASPLGENNDKLQLTRQLLDLKQDKQLYRNLHEEINQLALKLEKQGKGEGKNISTRRKHINKMWLKIQSHLKDCQDNLQLALEASTFFQQADNFIASVNNMRKALSVTNQATFSGDGEILDIASQIMFGATDQTNDNGERLLSFSNMNNFCIGNTYFRHKNIHKKTWRSPDGATYNEIDFICISRRWRSALLDVRAYRGADVGSDHYLVRSSIRCKSDKKAWLECKGAEAHEAASKNDNKTLYRIVRELTGAWSNSSAPIKNKDGVFLLTREEQDACWIEHFKETLNQPTPANTYDFGATPPPPDLVVNLYLITIEETKVAIRTLKANKAPGLDEIATEMLKHGGDAIANTLTVLFNKCWQDQSVPSDWRKGVIVKLPKKGNNADCNNWRGITLLLVPGKVFCSVLLWRLQHAVDKILREEQAGFRVGRSCSEQIYMLRNIIEQCIEFQRLLLINFIDFKKAFDSVHRGSLWKILRAYGIPQWFVNVFQNLYISSSCCVRTDDGYTDFFNIETGVKQGYDIALLANTKPVLQSMTTCLEGEAEKVGLRINTDKTKAMRVNRQTKVQITIGQQTVEDIDEFTYLSSIVSNNDGGSEADVRCLTVELGPWLGLSITWAQTQVLDVTVSQLSNLHPALAARVAEKQAKVKDSWLLLQSTVRNVKTEPLTSVCFVTGEDSDLSISNKELFSSMGMDQHRIMGKEVKDEQNRLKGTTGGRSLDLTRKPLDSHQEPLPNPVVSVGNTCTSEVSTKFQDQSKSGAMLETHSHPHLHEQLEKFTVSADKVPIYDCIITQPLQNQSCDPWPTTLSWLKDSVTMATHICSSGGGPSSYEAAKRYQASLEQDILSNKARIELVKKEGHSLVRAHHPGSAKIQDFLSQLEVLWEELKKRHQRNGMILRGSEELNYRAVKLLQGLGSLEAWLEAVELSIRQASLAGDPESVSVAERESRLLERELETHNLDLHNLKQELEALQSQRHLHTQLLPSRMEQVERKFRSIQMALTQQSSELKDTRMLTEFLERVELEENHYGSVGQPLQSDLDCASPLLPLRESRNSKPLIESLGDPVEELREAVEMLNDTARERSRSQSHDQCIQELISRHSIVVARVEQCLQRCTELAVDVLDMESEMAVRCEPEHCGMDSLQEQQDQLEADFAGLKEKVDAMDNLSARLLDLCPERVHTLGNKVQSSLQAWGELAKSIAENRSRLLQFGHLRHFFRKYLAMISWTEDTRSRIFSESALHHENQGSLVELLDKQIEQKFQEFDILASAGKKLLNEDHHLAKMIKERMEELRSMLGWILVHWRAQKIQWLNRKRAEEPHNDAIYSEATICSLLPELESETSSEDQLKTQGPVTVSLSGLEDNVQQDNGYELMESVTLKDSKTQSGSEELDSPYLVLKEPSTPSLGGTVNLILSFGNSGDSQLQVEESDTEKAEQFSEAVHRVSTYLKLKDTVPPVAPVYESMTLPQPHGIMQIPASSCPFTSLYLSSSPDMDCTTIHSLPMSSANSIFSNLKSKSIKRKKKKGIHRHTVQKIMGVEPSEKASSTMHEHVMYNMHTWPLKEKKKRKSGRKSDCKETQLLGYVKNPLAKHIDAECPRGLPGPLMELPTTATTDYVKNHCRFLSLGSVLSFDLPTDMSLIPSIQDIITIGSADSRKAAPPNKDSHTEHYTALSTFKLARSQPTHKNNESKRSPPGEINLKTDFQDNQRIHKDAISVSHKDFPFHHLSAEHSSKESLILSLSKPTSDHQTADNPAFNKGSSQQSEESISARNHCQNSTAEIHSYPNVHTLIQEFNGHQYHKAKPTCSQPRRESPVLSQSHASHIVLNFTSNGRQDLVDSRHSNSGSFKLCTEDSYFDTLEFPAPRRAVGKLFSLELESHKNMECLKIEPTNLPEDDPVHPDHQQFEQEEEELEDIWNQTNSYRQSICSDIMYQNSEAEPTICSSDHQREPSPKEVVLVRHLISASTPNLLGAEFRLPSSSHTLMGYGKDCNIREEGHVLAKRERRSWAAFPQQDQSSKEGVLINETASDSVTLPEIEDQQKYIYKYREEEEEEEDTGGMKVRYTSWQFDTCLYNMYICIKSRVYNGHSLNFLSVHIDLEGAGPDSDTLVHSPTTRGHSSLVSGRREFPSMEGTLERKHKLLVGGRMALCRTWSSYHAVLYRQTLCFYHDRKDTISNSVISFPINLNGAECVQAPEYTKKPNCFSLRLCDGSEYLFSAPSHFMMKKWILQIQANTDSLGDLPDQKLHSQSFRGLSYSLCPSQDCSTSKKRSHSFTSATYQRIKPVRLPPKGRRQDSNSSYSVTLFIGDGEKPSVCSSTALLQPISSRQKSPELPHMSYASLPQSQSKSIFRKFFGKKD